MRDQLERETKVGSNIDYAPKGGGRAIPQLWGDEEGVWARRKGVRERRATKACHKGVTQTLE